jgi:hypothetical protein
MLISFMNLSKIQAGSTVATCTSACGGVTEYIRVDSCVIGQIISVDKQCRTLYVKLSSNLVQLPSSPLHYRDPYSLSSFRL